MAASTSTENLIVDTEDDSETDAEESDNVVPGATPIAKMLGRYRINDQDIKNLKESGFPTIESVAFAKADLLCEFNKISIWRAHKLKDNALRLIPDGGIDDWASKMARRMKITTGSRALDALIEGGIESGFITGLFGESRTGKSQLCHTLAVTCQLPLDRGGGAGKCMYIDTEGTFRPQRLVEIAKHYKLNPTSVLANVVLARCHNTTNKVDLLQEAAHKMCADRYSLIIVDSATHLYRINSRNKEKRALQRQHLDRFLMLLMNLADSYEVAGVITNQVLAQTTSPYGVTKRPISLATATQLHLKKGEGENRVCEVNYCSGWFPEGQATFAITPNGIADAEKNKE